MATRKVKIEFEIDENMYVNSDTVLVLHEQPDGTMQSQGMITDLELRVSVEDGGVYKLTKLEAVIG